MADYIRYYQKPGESLFPQDDLSKVKTDVDILRENWKFIRDETDNDDSTWEKRMAKRYYDKLFKEYCISDLKHYRHGQVRVILCHSMCCKPQILFTTVLISFFFLLLSLWCFDVQLVHNACVFV